jgi:hypothetical protein
LSNVSSLTTTHHKPFPCYEKRDSPTPLAQAKSTSSFTKVLTVKNIALAHKLGRFFDFYRLTIACPRLMPLFIFVRVIVGSHKQSMAHFQHFALSCSPALCVFTIIGYATRAQVDGKGDTAYVPY